MDEAPDLSKDPHWDLTLEIAGKLWLYGEHLIELERTPTQRLVDVQWAARQAGRLIGVRTHLEMVPRPDASRSVLMRITYSDPDGRALIRAQDGLDALVRSVRAQQLAQEQLRQRRSSRPPSSPS